MIDDVVGVVGLGTMGARIAGHLARSGVSTLGFDSSESVEPPDGVVHYRSIEAVASRASILLLSLPHAGAVKATVDQLVRMPSPRTTLVIDLSTIGMLGAEEAARELSQHGIGFVDCPVSGPIAAAASGQLSLMVAAPDDLMDSARPILDLIGQHVVHVGRRAGLGQAMKVINNAISGTTLAVTSEALAVGCELGLDLATMLDVVNASSGRSVASDRKFPEQVLTGEYAHGGPGAHFQKDIGLFVEIASRSEVDHRLSSGSAGLWDEFATEWPGADQTEIFLYHRREPGRRPRPPEVRHDDRTT